MEEEKKEEKRKQRLRGRRRRNPRRATNRAALCNSTSRSITLLKGGGGWRTYGQDKTTPGLVVLEEVGVSARFMEAQAVMVEAKITVANKKSSCISVSM